MGVVRSYMQCTMRARAQETTRARKISISVSPAARLRASLLALAERNTAQYCGRNTTSYFVARRINNNYMAACAFRQARAQPKKKYVFISKTYKE